MNMPDTGTLPPLRLLVVDDQPIIRRGLALMLGAEPGISVVGQAGDGQEALDMALSLHPDVVLMDLQMPHVGGVVATRRITQALPHTRVVVLTTFDDDERVFEAVLAGAQAYLLKDATEDEVLETVRAVQRGESRLSSTVARKVLDQFRNLAHAADKAAPPAVDPNQEALTDKEDRVLALLAEGLSNRAIADQMFLAEGTIKNYVSRIMEQLHARYRTELAVMAAARRE